MTDTSTPKTFTAFAQGRRIASGTQAEVAAVLRQLPADTPALFVFDDQSGSPIDLDLREAAQIASDGATRNAGKGDKGQTWDEAGAATGTIATSAKRSTQASAAKRQSAVETELDTEADKPAPRGVGRPKLGVVAREVTLLPRHWDWLNRQPGGASVALRKLVEEARRVNAERDAVRAARELAYRFMSAIAGHEPGFEEASRALFAGDQASFAALIAPWPKDVSAHLSGLAAPSWSQA